MKLFDCHCLTIFVKISIYLGWFSLVRVMLSSFSWHHKIKLECSLLIFIYSESEPTITLESTIATYNWLGLACIPWLDIKYVSYNFVDTFANLIFVSHQLVFSLEFIMSFLISLPVPINFYYFHQCLFPQADYFPQCLFPQADKCLFSKQIIFYMKVFK